MQDTKPNSEHPDQAVDWEAKYREGQTPWDRGEANPALAQWIHEGKLPSGRVLVPGCGRGYEVIALAQAGWSVTAIDSARSAVQSLRERLAALGLDAVVELADLFEWSPADGPFDLIYEQTCLCALPPSQWSEYAIRLAQWLPHNGVLAALFMQTGKPGGPPYNCPLPTMHSLFSAPTWDWSTAEHSIHSPHPAGVEESCVLLRRVVTASEAAI